MARNVFTPVIAAGLLLILAGYASVRAGLTGVGFMPSLNRTNPALARVEPVISDAPPRLSRRVIVVIVDGLRLDASFGLPFLDSMRRRGVDAAAVSHYPTISRPNYVSIVTGVPPRFSGVRTNHYHAPVLIDSLMDRAREAGLPAAVATDESDGLPEMFTRPVAENEHVDGGFQSAYVSDFDQAHFTPWKGGFVTAARTLIDLRHPLVVLLPSDVDVAGHEAGADSDEYREAVRRVDRELAHALANVDWSRDTVIVTADHGHTDPGGHGGLEPEVVDVPLVMAGAGIRPGAAIAEAELIDVAPTAAVLLGLPAPGHALGKTLTDALVLDDGTRAAIERSDELRILRNHAITQAALSDAEVRVTRKRILRAPIVAILAVVGVLVIVGARRSHALYIDWRVLLLSLPAFPLTYYALLGLFGHGYSPSFFTARGDVQADLFRFGLISTTVHVIVAWIALRGRVVLRDRLAAANALTACGLFMAMLPAGLAWALIPKPYVDVPGPTLMVLVPATYIAVSTYAVAAAVTLGLEIVIFFARAVDPRVRLRRLQRAVSREQARIEHEDEDEDERSRPD